MFTIKSINTHFKDDLKKLTYDVIIVFKYKHNLYILIHIL